MDMKYKNNHQDHFDSGFREALALKIEKVIQQGDLKSFRKVVEETCKNLDIDVLDCAAALASLYKPGLSQHRQHMPAHPPMQPHKPAKNHYLHNDIKMVRYRLEVGRKHKITIDDLKRLLIEETGVDRKHIGYIDMHQHYTLLKLPDGMPHDIYNHLKTVQINQQVLKIKRLGGYNKQQQRHNNAEKPLVNRNKQRKIHGKIKNSALGKAQADGNN